jgi:RNA polymerase sigma factor (TIGR02999 family)
VQKRGGGQSDVRLDDVQAAAEQRAEDILALDEALQHLAQKDERLSTVVDYRFFGGLTYEQIAEIMGTSVATAKRDWRHAQAWLYQALKDGRVKS